MLRRALPPLLYHAAGFALGIVWFTLLVTGWSLGVGLLVTVVGVFVLAATWEAARLAAGVEASLAVALLGADARAPAPVQGLRARARDEAGWRAQAFLLSRFVLGLPVGAALLALLAQGLGLLVAPLWYWAVPDGIELGLLQVDTLPLAIAAMPVGALLLALTLWLTALSAGPARRLAEWGLPGARLQAPAGRRVRAAREPLPPVDWRAVSANVLRAAVTAEAIVLVVWLATGAHGRWFAWPAVGLLLPVGWTAVAAAKDGVPAGRPRRLAVHGGLAGVTLAGLVGVWALAGPGYFWPVWAAIGLGASVAVHALLPVAAPRELRERLERVEASRAGVVDARDDELRRIERDLHDGAQARLVAVAMGLGRAEERLDEDPGRARELVLEAQDQARAAIKELRDLARGIAPPVLADRGLVPAVEALAGTSPLAVAVHGALRDRPALAVERTAYFVVAEALTNAAKHAGPRAHVDVTVSRVGGVLVVAVADDGPGGAAAAPGSGLAGLAQRVEALDGTLRVDSKPGEGTTLTATLPWR